MRRDRSRRDAKAQAPTRWAADRSQISFSFVVRANDRLGMPKQRTAGLGQVELLVDSQEQRRAHFCFELANVNADCGLRQMYAQGCLSEGAGFGNDLKRP